MPRTGSTTPDEAPPCIASLTDADVSLFLCLLCDCRPFGHLTGRPGGDLYPIYSREGGDDLPDPGMGTLPPI